MKTTLLLIVMTTCLAWASTEEELTKTFAVSPNGTLVVDLKSGSITVQTNDTSEVAVDVWRKISRPKKKTEEEFLRKNPVVFKQDGDTVTVRCSHREKKRLFGIGRHNRNEAKYVVRVPSRFNVDLDTAGGPIAINDLTGSVKADSGGGGLHFIRVSGTIHANTSGGRIEMTDCDGRIEADTSGGGITVSGGGGSLVGESSGGGVTVRDFAGGARVKTSGGRIVIENVSGEVHARTSGGGVAAVLPATLPGPVSLATSGGGITVKIPELTAFELDAKASGGNVTSEFAVTVIGDTARARLKGSVNGGGPTVELRSSGGGIHVKKL